MCLFVLTIGPGFESQRFPQGSLLFHALWYKLNFFDEQKHGMDLEIENIFASDKISWQKKET